MPNVTKYNKEYILKQSLMFVEEYGFDAINARDLAKYMDISTQPIFKNYKNMYELKEDIFKTAKKEYLEYVHSRLDQDNYFFSILYNLILYAKNNVNLFKTIFYSEYSGKRTVAEIIDSEQNQNSIKIICKKYRINKSECEEIYRDLRFYVHGIANQLIFNTVEISDEELKYLINNMINKLLKKRRFFYGINLRLLSKTFMPQKRFRKRTK